MRQLRGFLPWIAYPIAGAAFDWRIAALIALALAGAGLLASRGTEAAPDMFARAATVFFAGVTILAFTDPASVLHHYVGALTPATLSIAAVVSIVLGQPFTIPFAKRIAPRELWDTQVFMHINMVLTAVWATSFAAMAVIIAAVLAFHPQAGGIIILAQVAGFVLPMRICRWYPASVRARALSASREQIYA